MLSKNQQKYINALQQKKFRQEYGAFTVEGAKSVLELLNSSFELELLFVTDEFYKENKTILEKQPLTPEIVTQAELERVGTFSSNNAALAVAKTKSNSELLVNAQEYALVLDDIRDPGNLGTIIRLCDWFGIETLFCSEESVDIYNPKVVQATMGSISRVNVVYGNLEAFLTKTKLPVFGTFMDGKNIYQEDLPKEGIIIMGNEANGISTSVEKLVSERIAIPRFGNLQVTESLNVATATAIILSEFKRK